MTRPPDVSREGCDLPYADSGWARQRGLRCRWASHRCPHTDGTGGAGAGGGCRAVVAATIK